jgi:hypothetical protein
MANDQREARIVDLDSEDGEVEPGMLSMPGPSRAQFLIGFVVVAAAAALAFGPLGVGHGQLGRSAAPTASRPAVAPPVVAPSPYAVTVTPPPPASLGPLTKPGAVPDGWPVSLDSTGSVSVGPDGTVYLGHQAALDAGGRPRTGWLTLPDGTQTTPCAYGSDGTIYAETVQQSRIRDIWIFGPDGKLRMSSPVEVAEYSQVVPGPGGSVYFVEPQYGDAAASTIQIVAPNGSGAAIVTPGSAVGGVVAGDGTIYITLLPNQMESTGLSLRILGPNGAQVGSDSEPVYWGTALAPDGTPYAWGYEPGSAPGVVVRSRIAAFDQGGKPKPGWPAIFEFGVSAPAFGPDGTVYMAALDSTVIALGPDGVTRAGWPVALPSGDQPFPGTLALGSLIPQPPIVDDRGRVYVAGKNLQGQATLTAIDRSGKTPNGWPLTFDSYPAAGGGDYGFGPSPVTEPVLVRMPSGRGRIYMALNDEIAAIDESGKPVPQWQVGLPGIGDSWYGIWATPDGGLVVAVAQGSVDYGVVLQQILRFTPEGQVSL